MPFFISDAVRVQATCYFTIMALCRHSAKMSQPVFDKVRNAGDWEYLITQILGSTPAEVEVAREEVEGSLYQLDGHDLVVQRGGQLYPKRLSGIMGSPEFLFLRGEALLTDSPVISVVGTRNPSEDGEKRARRLARLLSERNIVVASGLARGIDRSAHLGTRDAQRPTIAVIGTALNKAYPVENKALQECISETGLVISQFLPGAPVQRWNFPLRNSTMSGISVATIVVEAGETSGALIQAREALKQKRRVFIPLSALQDEMLRWPKKLINEVGASEFSTIDSLMYQLQEDRLITPIVDIPKSDSTTYVVR